MGNIEEDLGEIPKHCVEKMCMLKNTGEIDKDVQWEVNRAGGKMAKEAPEM